jgi:hypothetical protein
MLCDDLKWWITDTTRLCKVVVKYKVPRLSHLRRVGSLPTYLG